MTRKRRSRQNWSEFKPSRTTCIPRRRSRKLARITINMPSSTIIWNRTRRHFQTSLTPKPRSTCPVSIWSAVEPSSLPKSLTKSTSLDTACLQGHLKCLHSCFLQALTRFLRNHRPEFKKVCFSTTSARLSRRNKWSSYTKRHPHSPIVTRDRLIRSRSYSSNSLSKNFSSRRNREVAMVPPSQTKQLAPVRLKTSKSVARRTLEPMFAKEATFSTCLPQVSSQRRQRSQWITRRAPKTYSMIRSD